MRAMLLLHLSLLFVLVGCTSENLHRREPATTKVDQQGTDVIRIDYPTHWERDTEPLPGQVVFDDTARTADPFEQHAPCSVSRRVVLQIDKPADPRELLQRYANTLEIEVWQLNCTSVLRVEKEVIDSIGPIIRIHYESNSRVGTIHATVATLEPNSPQTNLLFDFLKIDPVAACLPCAKLREITGTYLAVFVQESRQ